MSFILGRATMRQAELVASGSRLAGRASLFKLVRIREAHQAGWDKEINVPSPQGDPQHAQHQCCIRRRPCCPAAPALVRTGLSACNPMYTFLGSESHCRQQHLLPSRPSYWGCQLPTFGKHRMKPASLESAHAFLV